MKFIIDTSTKTMCVDAAIYAIDTSGVAANVARVTFDGELGSVLPSNAPPIEVPTSDPSPYQPQFNLWMAAAESAAPALTLAQAQKVKSTLVDMIFDFKRQEPISFTVGSPYNWDCSDQALNALNQAAVAAIISGGLLDAENDIVALLVSIFSGGGTYTSQINNAFIAVSGGGTSSGISGFSPANRTSVTFPSVSWAPIGNAPIALTGTQLAGLLAAIAARRATVLAAQQTALTAIAAFTTIAQVIAFDVTAGWPY